MKNVLLSLFVFFTACTTAPAGLPVVAPSAPSEGGREEAAPAPRRPVVLNADRILSVLGEPDVRRFEAPSEVWIYSRPSCVLFIYMDSKGETSPRVRHMEIGTPSFGVSEKESADCLRLAEKLR